MDNNKKTFIEIHTLQNYAPSNLNRDDTGSVKDCLFGGYPRARISSQSRKRSIRKSDFFQIPLREYLGKRTKYLPSEIKENLIKKGFSENEASKWAEKFNNIGKNKDNKQESKNELATDQLIFYGKEELDKIIKWIVENKNKDKTEDFEQALSNLENLPKPVDIALFGRMTTMRNFVDVNAACQVSHAISVNEFKTEFDYFTAVDDLGNKYREDSGSAHLGETEFTSSCFYQYYAIDYDSFLISIGRKEDIAKSTIGALLEAIVLSHPTGKQNSFAAHNPSHFVGIEIKNKKIPINLANAFIVPIRPNNNKSLSAKAAEELANYANKCRNAFDSLLSIRDTAVFLLDGKEAEGHGFSNNRFEKLDDLKKWLLNNL